MRNELSVEGGAARMREMTMAERTMPGVAGAQAALGGWAGKAAGWLRRLAQAPVAGEAALRVEARLGLGPKKSLVLVSCRGREVLLAVSGESIAPLMEVTGPGRGAKSPGARRPGKQKPAEQEGAAQ